MICQSAPVFFNLKWCKLTVHPTNWCSIILRLLRLPFLGYFLILQIGPMTLEQAQQVPPSPFRISQCPPVVLLRRRSHTGNSGERIDRRGGEKPSRACYGVRVKRTRISTRLYQLNQYLWIEHSQVLQQVECRTANSSVAPLKIIPFLFLSAVYLNWVSSPFVRSPYHLEKVNPRVIFILIFALIVVFTLVVPDGFAQWYSGGVLWGNSWCKWG